MVHLWMAMTKYLWVGNLCFVRLLTHSWLIHLECSKDWGDTTQHQWKQLIWCGTGTGTSKTQPCAATKSEDRAKNMLIIKWKVCPSSLHNSWLWEVPDYSERTILGQRWYTVCVGELQDANFSHPVLASVTSWSAADPSHAEREKYIYLGPGPWHKMLFFFLCVFRETWWFHFDLMALLLWPLHTYYDSANLEHQNH